MQLVERTKGKQGLLVVNLPHPRGLLHMRVLRTD